MVYIENSVADFTGCAVAQEITVFSPQLQGENLVMEIEVRRYLVSIVVFGVYGAE